ncbi:MAG: alternative ribosome rescue aminoacyl-tRNA hydrolase ArfB [Frankiaceae bacterium]|jgi:ribosome-associated protein
MYVTAGWEVPENELRWRFSRSSGPGGQSVNTTDSRVELSFDVVRADSLPGELRGRALERLGSRLVDGVLTVTASEHRSQWRNRQAALSRLAALLQDAIRPPSQVRRPTRPSRRARERRMYAKQHRAGIKRLRGRPEE